MRNSQFAIELVSPWFGAEAKINSEFGIRNSEFGIVFNAQFAIRNAQLKWSDSSVVMKINAQFAMRN